MVPSSRKFLLIFDQYLLWKSIFVINEISRDPTTTTTTSPATTTTTFTATTEEFSDVNVAAIVVPIVVVLALIILLVVAFVLCRIKKQVSFFNIKRDKKSYNIYFMNRKR